MNYVGKKKISLKSSPPSIPPQYLLHNKVHLIITTRHSHSNSSAGTYTIHYKHFNHTPFQTTISHNSCIFTKSHTVLHPKITHDTTDLTVHQHASSLNSSHPQDHLHSSSSHTLVYHATHHSIVQTSKGHLHQASSS